MAIDNIEIAYYKAVELLQKNSRPFGILASQLNNKAQKRNYDSIFGRDASICAMGMIVSGDKKLNLSALRSLATLARHQADNGQIPFYVKSEKKEADFYYFGSIDSTLWWLIAIDFVDKNSNHNLRKKYKKEIDKAINWLRCQEHPNFYLLCQNEASDWADLMPRSGLVAYSNALWYWTKMVYKLSKSLETKKYFNYIFDPRAKIPKKDLSKNTRLQKLLLGLKGDKKLLGYRSFVARQQSGQEFDVFANILAALLGLSSKEKTKEIIKYIKDENLNQTPIKATAKPIKKSDKLWRDYMVHLNLNKPGQYHNGGVWPFIGAFWVMLLALAEDDIVLNELEKLAELNKKNNWDFNEWFDGQSLKPKGMHKQSWNGAMYILAYKHILV